MRPDVETTAGTKKLEGETENICIIGRGKKKLTVELLPPFLAYMLDVRPCKLRMLTQMQDQAAPRH